MKDWEIILPIGSVILILLLRVSELRTKREVVPGATKEKVTLPLFVGCGVVVIICGIIELLVRNPAFSVWWFFFGCLLAFASFRLRAAAIAALGRFWSLHVEIRENHKLVNTGPFRWMRHPTYCSMFLELLAVVVILQSWWSMLLIIAVYLPILSLRLRIEEKALVEKFGEVYRTYQASTPALFPYKWQTPNESPNELPAP